MNILIFTNTFTPHVGGVARSVEAFVREYRQRGHGVLVVAPEFQDMPMIEKGVFRVSAIQNFNASDFSVALPFHQGLSEAIDEFKPDIVHSQHPFLLGMTALRAARVRQLPLVFTHHTLYEQYTHYVPGDSPALKRFAIELATRYANQCDQVITPSDSIRQLLNERGVTVPINVVPTGICLENFVQGRGAAVREQLGIPQDAFVVGHLGRLAPEKNLEFMTQAVADFMASHPNSHFLVIGAGPSEAAMVSIFQQAGLASRLHLAGVLQQQSLADALHAMDVFAFTSQSETQGMVLTEAMAAGLPVVALDAAGVREVVRDTVNGRMLQKHTIGTFSGALAWLVELASEQRAALRHRALETAETYSMTRSTDKALACFEALISQMGVGERNNDLGWEDILVWIKTEWDILKSVAEAGDAAINLADLEEQHHEKEAR
jgi:glycosyltransferase involved in cell wall biosynthesis